MGVVHVGVLTRVSLTDAGVDPVLKWRDNLWPLCVHDTPHVSLRLVVDD